jgi:putative spermidine/putrescine transport system ATP-binding protein
VARGLADAQAGEVRSLALRPEAVSLVETGPDRNHLQGAVEEVSFLGAIVRIRVRLKENAISFDAFNNPSVPPPERGRPVTIGFAHEDLQVLATA